MSEPGVLGRDEPGDRLDEIVGRHPFPQHPRLPGFRQEIDACASASDELRRSRPPFEALADWLRRFASFITTKRGFSTALHSGNPAYTGLPGHFEERLYPALDGLLAEAWEARVLREGVTADDLVKAVARLVAPEDTGLGQRMLEVLIDGLRVD